MADLDVPNLIEVAGDPDDAHHKDEEDDGDDDHDHREAERRVRKLSASYRSQTGHLTSCLVYTYPRPRD